MDVRTPPPPSPPPKKKKYSQVAAKFNMGQQKPGEKQSDNANHGGKGSEIWMENKQEAQKAAPQRCNLGKEQQQMITVLNPVKNETVI